MQYTKVIIIVLLSIAALIIVFQNTDQVATKILFFTFSMPRAALLFGTFVSGFIVGILTALHFLSAKSAKAAKAKSVAS